MNDLDGFRRGITYRIHKSEKQCITLTATMVDRLHDMELTVVVEETSLVIQSAAVAFRRAPTPLCENAAAGLEMLQGIQVGSGLEWKLKKAVGCRNGCGNLLNLLRGLLPLALNYRASADRGKDGAGELLLGTCAGYPASSAEGEEPAGRADGEAP